MQWGIQENSETVLGKYSFHLIGIKLPTYCFKLITNLHAISSYLFVFG